MQVLPTQRTVREGPPPKTNNPETFHIFTSDPDPFPFLFPSGGVWVPLRHPLSCAVLVVRTRSGCGSALERKARAPARVHRVLLRATSLGPTSQCLSSFQGPAPEAAEAPSLRPHGTALFSQTLTFLREQHCSVDHRSLCREELIRFLQTLFCPGLV